MHPSTASPCITRSTAAALPAVIRPGLFQHGLRARPHVFATNQTIPKLEHVQHPASDEPGARRDTRAIAQYGGPIIVLNDAVAVALGCPAWSMRRDKQPWSGKRRRSSGNTIETGQRLKGPSVRRCDGRACGERATGACPRCISNTVPRRRRSTSSGWWSTSWEHPAPVPVNRISPASWQRQLDDSLTSANGITEGRAT